MEQSNNTQKPQLTRNSSFAVLSLDHLQKILSTRSFHRIKEDHAIKLNELFQQEVGRAASHITAPPKFKEKLIQEHQMMKLQLALQSQELLCQVRLELKIRAHTVIIIFS